MHSQNVTQKKEIVRDLDKYIDIGNNTSQYKKTEDIYNIYI